MNTSSFKPFRKDDKAMLNVTAENPADMLCVLTPDGYLCLMNTLTQVPSEKQR